MPVRSQRPPVQFTQLTGITLTRDLEMRPRRGRASRPLPVAGHCAEGAAQIFSWVGFPPPLDISSENRKALPGIGLGICVWVRNAAVREAGTWRATSKTSPAGYSQIFKGLYVCRSEARGLMQRTFPACLWESALANSSRTMANVASLHKGQYARPPRRHAVPNFRSLMALKSCTPPPTRLVV